MLILIRNLPLERKHCLMASDEYDNNVIKYITIKSISPSKNTNIDFKIYQHDIDEEYTFNGHINTNANYIAEVI